MTPLFCINGGPIRQKQLMRIIDIDKRFELMMFKDSDVNFFKIEDFKSFCQNLTLSF